MKDRRSWSRPCTGRNAIAPIRVRPGTIHRTNPSQFAQRIARLETPIQARTRHIGQTGRSLRILAKSSGSWRSELPKIRPTIKDLIWWGLAAGVLFFAASGCTVSTTRYGWPGSYAPAGVPNAQNCVPFTFGQPTEFACPDGKVYTAQKLKALREPKATGSTVASLNGY